MSQILDTENTNKEENNLQKDNEYRKLSYRNVRLTRIRTEQIFLMPIRFQKNAIQFKQVHGFMSFYIHIRLCIEKNNIGMINKHQKF